MLLKLLILLLLSPQVFAFKLSPIVQSFGFSKKERTKSFRIINTNKEKIKIETSVLTRATTSEGEEKRTETDDFIVYPPMFEIEAGKSQVLRVSYLGADSKNEKPYRLIVRQIPGAQKEGVQLTVVLEYIASLYVGPRDTKPKLKVLKAYMLNGSLYSEIINEGSKHILFNVYDLDISQNKKNLKIDLKRKKFKKWNSINFLPGEMRKIKIPLASKKLEDGKVNLRLVRD